MTTNDQKQLLASVGRGREWKPGQVWIWYLTRMFGRARKRMTRSNIKRATRELADDDLLRSAFESVCRLGDEVAASAWVQQRYAPPPLTEEQKRAARLDGVVKRAKEEEAHARAMLKEHQRLLKLERTLVKKWAAKVRYYDRKQAKEGA